MMNLHMTKVYIAGPGVFCRPNVRKMFFNAIRYELKKHNMVSLIPIDDNEPSKEQSNDIQSAMEIRKANIKMIRDCDVVIADISPFRGTGPDAGTVYEVGYAQALGKPVILLSDDLRTYKERCEADTQNYHSSCQDVFDKDDKIVEDFGLVDNLMFASGCPVVKDYLEAIDIIKNIPEFFNEKTGYDEKWLAAR